MSHWRLHRSWLPVLSSTATWSWDTVWRWTSRQTSAPRPQTMAVPWTPAASCLQPLAVQLRRWTHQTLRSHHQAGRLRRSVCQSRLLGRCRRPAHVHGMSTAHRSCYSVSPSSLKWTLRTCKHTVSHQCIQGHSHHGVHGGCIPMHPTVSPVVNFVPPEPILAPSAYSASWFDHTAATAAAFHSQRVKLDRYFKLRYGTAPLFAVNSTPHHCPPTPPSQSTQHGFTPECMSVRYIVDLP